MSDAALTKTIEYLAAAYVDHGKWAQAEKHYQQILTLLERASSRESLEYAAMLGASQNIYPIMIRRPNPAVIAVLRRALKNHQAGANQEHLSLVRRSLARLLTDDRRYREATLYLADEYESVRARSPTSRESMFISAAGLGVAERQLKNYQHAIALFQESLLLRESIFGRDHPILIRALNGLAATYGDLHQDEAAARIFERIIGISLAHNALQTDSIFGIALGNYAQVLKRLGRKSEARQALIRSRYILSVKMRREEAGITIPISSLLQIFP